MENIYRKTAWLFDIEHAHFNSEDTVTSSDVPFYLDYAKHLQGEVLELGCGTGRVALKLAKEGFHVTGLDLSTQMLDIFREKVVKQPEIAKNIEIIHGSMANFSIDRKFALIIAPFRAFQAITDKTEIENALSCIREHLSEDGIFIVNVFKPYAEPLDESWCREEIFQDEIIDEQTGIRIARYECRERIDIENQIIYPYLAYGITYPDGRTERLVEPLKMKYYYSNQLRAIIELAGMEIAEEYSWYDKSTTDNREIILVCRRER
jgi:SAM-dependent methyltransferase